MQNTVWITWERQRRNAELSKRFGAQLVIVDHGDQSALFRYLFCTFETIKLLWRERPRLVFVQSPSIVLVAMAVLLKRPLAFRLVVDSHNVAIEQALSRQGLVSAIARFGLKCANWVIVSNVGLEKQIKEIQTNTIVLPDPLPTIHGGGDFYNSRSREVPVVTLICSFASDEPIREFIEASRDCRLPHVLYVTGSRKKAKDLLKYESESIRFTGFLAAQDFENLIAGSDVLADLTTRDNCLVCGAYEALAVGVPCVLSDTEALRDTFRAGFIFSRNSKTDLQRAIETALSEQNKYKSDIKLYKSVFESMWTARFLEANRKLGRKATIN